MSDVFYYTGLIIWLLSGLFGVLYVVIKLIDKSLSKAHNIQAWFDFLNWRMKKKRKKESEVIE